MKCLSSTLFTEKEDAKATWCPIVGSFNDSHSGLCLVDNAPLVYELYMRPEWPLPFNGSRKRKRDHDGESGFSEVERVPCALIDFSLAVERDRVKGSHKHAGGLTVRSSNNLRMTLLTFR